MCAAFDWNSGNFVTISQNKGTSGRKDRKDEKVFDLYDPYVMHFKR